MLLTERQQAVLDFIQSHHASSGVLPSLREIQHHFRFASPNAANKHLLALERKGLLQRSGGNARSMTVSGMEPPVHFLRVPLLGAISAGLPLDQEAQHDRFISVDADTVQLPRNARTFALKVQGDSMIGAGILDGDFVILEHGPQGHHGDIVAAAIDGEMTLKRLILKDRKAYLKAENPKYKTLTPAYELVIEGVFRALIRLNPKMA